MAAYQLPSIESAPADAKPLLEGPLKQLGFVPNLLLALSTMPPVLTSYVELSKQFAKAGLSGVEMQSALIVASVENACAYCVAAHSTFATNAKIDPQVLAALRHGRPIPDPKLEALATFVRSLVRARGHVPEDVFDRFLSAGYTHEQALGLLSGIAMKTIANFANHLVQTPLDPQFSAQRWRG